MNTQDNNKKNPDRMYRIAQLFVNLWALPACQELRFCQMYEHLKAFIVEKGYYTDGDWFYVEDNKLESWIKEYYNYLAERKTV